MLITHCPLRTSQTDTVWSNDPVMNWEPVELNDNAIISAE